MIEELRAIVRDEVVAAPIALEDGGDLVDQTAFRAREARTFHSSPLTCAECVRFDEPMYAVENPVPR
jgi:hypothetical protein